MVVSLFIKHLAKIICKEKANIKKVFVILTFSFKPIFNFYQAARMEFPAEQ